MNWKGTYVRIHIAKYEPERTGGGWTFMRNFSRGISDKVSTYEDCDIFFISSPSLISRDEVLQAKADGKKIVLRLDNAVRNSRNRNTGMTRMKDFAEWADLIIYQSEWAKNYLTDYIHKDGPVILNGIDLDLYTPGEKNENVLYSRFNRDETKNWEVARYWFSRQTKGKLIIVGQFSPELTDGNFDFYNGEQYEYFGVLDERNMAKLYSVTGKFLYTYYNDACSNSLIEALCAGCTIVGDEYYRTTGGAPEILDKFYSEGRDYFSLERMCRDYVEQLSNIA